MATLDDKVIVFDDSCPMCRLYTYGFVAWGFLRDENRVGFANLDPRILAQLDLKRARHEIPLFDRRSGVAYFTRGIRRWNLLGNCASILGMFSMVISPLIFLDQTSLISNAST